jgi:hypothetical protein
VILGSSSSQASCTALWISDADAPGETVLLYAAHFNEAGLAVDVSFVPLRLTAFKQSSQSGAPLVNNSTAIISFFSASSTDTSRNERSSHQNFLPPLPRRFLHETRSRILLFYPTPNDKQTQLLEITVDTKDLGNISALLSGTAIMSRTLTSRQAEELFVQGSFWSFDLPI